jgi:hypothetical protein
VIVLPLSAGAAKFTVICALPRVALGCAGASGAVGPGIAGAEAIDSGLEPSPFVAWTVHVYDVPFASDETTIGDAVPLLTDGVTPSVQVAV